MRLIEVEPTGTQKVTALVDWMGPDGKRDGGPREIDVPIYPPSANGLLLCTKRMQCCITVRRAAELLAISPSELGYLEHGRLTMSDEDWAALFKIVNAWEAKGAK